MDSRKHRNHPGALFDKVQRSNMATLRCVDGTIVLELEVGRLVR